MEKDPSGKPHPGGLAHYLTHTRSTVVHTRICSLGHKECEILYTGRHDGLHRQTYETMIRHEVALLYWNSLKEMGVSAAPFGSLLQQMHRLGGGRTEEYSRAPFFHIYFILTGPGADVSWVSSLDSGAI